MGAPKPKKPTLAEQADIHELYEESVQNVETEMEFLRTTFRELRGRDATSFREDFCGTASASCEWVRTGDSHYAIGVESVAPALRTTSALASNAGIGLSHLTPLECRIVHGLETTDRNVPSRARVLAASLDQ